MKATELCSVEAATWVWESLWSNRRHAKLDILDVALFNGGTDADAPPILSRWLFTAKDGRVVKKTTPNTSIGALKQALLGRVLHSTPEGSRDSRVTEHAPDQIFANALLGSGESVPLDESAWSSLVVRRSSQGESVAAVTSLLPIMNDSSKLRHGSRQRVICEHRAKYDHTTAEEVNRSFAKPLHASMTTYVLVSSGILRQAGDHYQPREKNKHHSTSKTSADGRLVSKSKATKQEVEAKMHRIVQWVQEVRRVSVVSMTVAFVVLPSTEKGLPGVWLERALDICILPRDNTSDIMAPIAVLNLISPSLNFQGAGGQKQGVIRCSSSVEQPDGSVVNNVQTESATSSRQCDGFTDETSKTESASIGTSEATNEPVVQSDNCTYKGKLYRLGEFSATSSEVQSTTAILSTTVGTLPLIHEIEMSKVYEGSGDAAQPCRDIDGKIPSARAYCHQSGRSTKISNMAGVDYDHKRSGCAGDFCAFQGQSQLSLPAKIAREDSKAGSIAQLDWTDVGVSNGNETLLKITKQSASRNGDGKNDIMFSLTFKSISLARMEANARNDVHWDESLRNYWREGRYKTGGLQGLGPSFAYKEVAVCRACYEVYLRLDNLREQAKWAKARGSSGADMVAMTESSGVSGIRATAAEVSAVRLNAEVTAMLEDVDAFTKKRGMEARKTWRRRLSKCENSCGLELGTARSQALLATRLAQPKQTPKTRTEEEADVTASASHKRRVKSQGDTPDQTDKRCQRRISEHSGFPPVVGRRDLAHPQRQGVDLNCPKGAKMGVFGGTSTLHGKQKRMAWPHQEDTRGNKVARDDAGKTMSQTYGVGWGLPGAAGYDFSRESRTTIRAIEAMLEKGIESYLPKCVRNLPKATNVLGSGLNLSKVKRDGRERQRCTGGRTRRSEGQDENKARIGEGSHDSGGGVFLDTKHAAEISGRNTSGEVLEDRLLHPWQRSLEADKRASGRTAEHKAALKEEQHRRDKARKAAMASEGCRRARERVVARMGGFRRRPRQRKIGGEQIGGIHSLRKPGKDGPRNNDEEINGSDLISIIERRDEGGRAQQGDRESGGGDKGVPNGGDGITQMRDMLGWARKSLGAILKRLRRRGLVADDSGKDGGVKNRGLQGLLIELRKHIMEFEATAQATLTSKGKNMTSLQPRCDAACELFEAEFSRLMDELMSEAKAHIVHLKSTTLGTKQNCTVLSTDGSPRETRPVSERPTKVTPEVRVSCFGLCPSCSVLPVARRCLDCQGDDTDRDRCAGCFVRDHRDTALRKHRFLRISGGRVPGTVISTRGAARAKQTLLAQDKQARAHAYSTRCSRCDDLAAARSCRDCGVDMCAACHFLAHRTPSRRAHVTDLVGETAVAMQEALHCSRKATDIQERREAAEDFLPPSISPACDHKEAGNDDVGGNVAWACEPDFGKDAAQSLAQVRRTVDPPVVRPLLRASSKALVTSPNSLHGCTPLLAKEALDGERDDLRSDGVCEKKTLFDVGCDCLDAMAWRNGVKAGDSGTQITNACGIDNIASASAAGGCENREGDHDHVDRREEIMNWETGEMNHESRAMSEPNSDGICCSSDNDSDEGMVSMVDEWQPCSVAPHIRRSNASIW